jgi:hypothetical protein
MHIQRQDGWPGIEFHSWNMFSHHASRLIGENVQGAKYLCRGQADSEWGLVPSVLRLFPDVSVRLPLMEVERVCKRQFQSQIHLYLSPEHLPEKIKSQDQYLEWWALMQHYKAPTRLLDWTSSPYIAAYFAVERSPDKDGVVFVVDHDMAQNFAHVGSGDKTLCDTSLMHLEAPDALFFWQPKKLSDRLRVQQGWFSVSLNPLQRHDDFDRILSPGDTTDSGPLRRWIFPHQIKREILAHLRLLNVGAASLFPGLDGFGKSITESAQLGRP